LRASISTRDPGGRHHLGRSALQGFRSDADFEAARRTLGRFRQVTILDLDPALLSARHDRALRKLGITIRKTIDCFIAT